MIYKIIDKNDLLKTKPFFNDIRFFMRNSLENDFKLVKIDEIKFINMADN